tara:strand:+ start:3129 stop:4343 length:1215 start_codon:yes stop_codon:yes gene_type:complete
MNSFAKKWKNFLISEVSDTIDMQSFADTPKIGKDSDLAYTMPAQRPKNPIEAALDEMDLTIKKQLKFGKEHGHGLESDVYRVISHKTSQESVVKVLPASATHSARDYRNYTHLKDHRDSWPKEVARHFVKVYKTLKREDYYFIFMEPLTEPPKELKRELFASGRDMEPCDAGKGKKRKEARIMADPIAVQKLTKHIVSKSEIKNILLRFNAKDSQERNSVDRISLNAFEHFARGKSSFSDEKLNYEFWTEQAAKYRGGFKSQHNCLNKRGRNLLDIIFVHILYVIGDGPRSRMGKDTYVELMQHIEEAYIDRIFVAGVIPMSTEPKEFKPREGEDEEITKKLKSMNVGAQEFSEIYPEVQGVMHAMQYVTKKKFTPTDVHVDNVMMRPSTNDLVITDVGNFRLT